MNQSATHQQLVQACGISAFGDGYVISGIWRQTVPLASAQVTTSDLQIACRRHPDERTIYGHESCIKHIKTYPKLDYLSRQLQQPGGQRTRDPEALFALTLPRFLTLAALRTKVSF